MSGRSHILFTEGDGDEAVERRADRAADLLSRRGAWLAQQAGGYGVRSSGDARRRPLLTLDEGVFRRLIATPGLKPRAEAGWVLAGRQAPTPPPPPGRLSVIEGERTVMEPDGRMVSRRANLGESPIAWLARRRDADGEPWLDAVEAAAAERLRDAFELCGRQGRLTMSWDSGPRARGGRGPGVEPVERARAAKARVNAALDAVGPELRGMLQHICMAGTALEAAERSLGIPRREGKHVPKRALGRLAEHYRIR